MIHRLWLFAERVRKLAFTTNKNRNWVRVNVSNHLFYWNIFIRSLRWLTANIETIHAKPGMRCCLSCCCRSCCSCGRRRDDIILLAVHYWLHWVSNSCLVIEKSTIWNAPYFFWNMFRLMPRCKSWKSQVHLHLQGHLHFCHRWIWYLPQSLTLFVHKKSKYHLDFSYLN